MTLKNDIYHALSRHSLTRHPTSHERQMAEVLLRVVDKVGDMPPLGTEDQAALALYKRDILGGCS